MASILRRALALAVAIGALVGAALTGASRAAAADPAPVKRIAAIVSVYTHHSHADLILTRLLEPKIWGGNGRASRLKLVSLYTDQVPSGDLSRGLSRQHGFTLYPRAEDALTLGTGKLAVDGVLLLCEHGDYPVSPTGQVQYPKRRLFEKIVRVMVDSGRVVPVFIDKHLADTWGDAKAIYDTARRLRIPLMAGSSLPVVWRYPPIDVAADRPLKELVGVTFHTLDGYGFHGLEMAQCLAERRPGGETGVRSVRAIAGDEVWKAGERGVYDRALLDAAIAKVLWRPYADPNLRKSVAQPVLWVVDYRDGLRVSVLTLNYAVGQWAAAWRYRDDAVSHATLFWTQELPPFMHFQYLLDGIEAMIDSGRPSWPVERTLLTSGTLDALLRSASAGGKELATPELAISYRSAWRWHAPPKPVPPYLYLPEAGK